jgi:hypothetical protein
MLDTNSEVLVLSPSSNIRSAADGGTFKEDGINLDVVVSAVNFVTIVLDHDTTHFCRSQRICNSEVASQDVTLHRSRELLRGV